MRVNRDRFASVVSYLSTFADQHSSVMFSPINDELICASITIDEIYAEYTFKPDRPLKARFAVRVGVLKQIASVVDGDVEYTNGSQAIIQSGKSKWWIPYSDLDQFEPRPEFEHTGRIDWDSSFCKWLSLMRLSALQADANGCLDCVLVNVKTLGEDDEAVTERLIVSTDRKVMQVYQDKIPGKQRNGKLLIERRHIQKILATCESGSKVEIRVGLNHYSIQCGRRTAVFAFRSGRFPKWNVAMSSAMRVEVQGKISTDRHYLGAAVRQAEVAGHAIRIDHDSEGIYVSSAFERCNSRIQMDVIHQGNFGPLTVSSDYLKQIASNWPGDRLLIESRGAGSPIVVRTPKDKRFTALYQTMTERRPNEPAIERASELAAEPV